MTSEHLDASSSYPQAGIITCQVIEENKVNGREIVKIDSELPWHIESTTGVTFFEILADQLIELK